MCEIARSQAALMAKIAKFRRRSRLNFAKFAMRAAWLRAISHTTPARHYIYNTVANTAIRSYGAFYFVRGIVSFKGRTLVFFAFFAFFGQQISKIGRVRRELDVRCRARNKMEVAMCRRMALLKETSQSFLAQTTTPCKLTFRTGGGQ